MTGSGEHRLGTRSEEERFGKVSWVVVHRMYGTVIREFLVIWDKLIEMRSGRRRGPCAKSWREPAD